MTILAACEPLWSQVQQKRKKNQAGCSRAVLFRRCLYGGRKGHAAQRRLGLDGEYALTIWQTYGRLYSFTREQRDRLVRNFILRDHRVAFP